MGRHPHGRVPAEGSVGLASTNQIAGGHVLSAGRVPDPDDVAPCETRGMGTRRTSSVGELPEDPVGLAAAELVGSVLWNAKVELHYDPAGDGPPSPPGGDTALRASRAVLDGWCTTMVVHLDDQVAGLLAPGGGAPHGPLASIPEAALRACATFAGVASHPSGTLNPAVRRALRDAVVVELLSQQGRAGTAEPAWLLAEILEYLIELSGTRVESHSLTHGVVITDAIQDVPRLSVPYPGGLRGAKRSPLLFDGQRSVLVVDRQGRARTELQRHRLDRLLPDSVRWGVADTTFVDSGSLVALATQRLGGIGFFLREDRSIWTFVDGAPLVIRRGEHWTAFPLWLAAAIRDAIGGGRAVDLVVQAALMISVQPSGAILGIVDGAADVEGTVEAKDRFDLRDQVDPEAMRPETKLHHLIDAGDMDPQTLARLAALDGATIVDRDGRLLAYGAIVTSGDSQHEGARTAAARTLSMTSLAVLKVSEDGEISVFRDGVVVGTLLRSGSSS